MRPLYHPPVSEITVQGILYALSDPVRVNILREMMNAQCAQNCATVSKLAGEPLAKSSLSQHFKVLREAGLIRSERKGAELQNTTRCAEVSEKIGRMIGAIMSAYEVEIQQVGE